MDAICGKIRRLPKKASRHHLARKEIKKWQNALIVVSPLPSVIAFRSPIGKPTVPSIPIFKK
jgi:hypothetical protein